jgi:hypothetical protein
MGQGDCIEAPGKGFSEEQKEVFWPQRARRGVCLKWHESWQIENLPDEP